jgi:hypothetical protein
MDKSTFHSTQAIIGINYYIENSYYDALLYGKINPRD